MGSMTEVGRLHPFIFDLVNDIALKVAQNQSLHSAKNYLNIIRYGLDAN
jgi:hypothetical protein